MDRSALMLALALGVALAPSGCDRGDRRSDAGEARSRAEAGEAEVREASPRPTGTPRPVQGTGMGAVGDENATLAMSGTPSAHLVDGAGSAVYALAGNTDGSKCDAACEEAWPPVIAHDAQPTAGTGVEQARIGVLQRGGRSHVTYGGKPLYRYAGDAGANRTAGAGVEDQWGKWSLVGLDGEALEDPR
jgi:predicted lipoprotein with Yx(FWY)xxD motif